MSPDPSPDGAVRKRRRGLGRPLRSALGRRESALPFLGNFAFSEHVWLSASQVLAFSPQRAPRGARYRLSVGKPRRGLIRKCRLTGPSRRDLLRTDETCSRGRRSNVTYANDEGSNMDRCNCPHACRAATSSLSETSPPESSLVAGSRQWDKSFAATAE